MPAFRLSSHRRLALLTLIVAIACLCSGRVAAAKAPKPNFIFVLIDDMGYADLSCYGGKPGLTPNIDSLAAEGIRFTQFYVGSPMCSASRTTFLTGQFPARWRITSYLASRVENERRGMAQWLDPKAPSLARTMHDVGYATGHFGKWHMGGQRDVGEAPLITQYGFDVSLTQFEGLGDRILPLLDKFDGSQPQKYALGSDKLGHGNIQWMDRSKVSGAFVAHAIDFIKEAQKSGKPFYVNVWPDDVHSPFYPPKSLRNNEAKRELYLSVTKALDTQLAPLFEYVRQTPSLCTNTIIIVASDNGPEPGAGSAAPLRGHKGNLYEGGIREPLIVWAPAFINPSARGTTNERTVVAGVDFFPTISRLAGIKLPAKQVFNGEDLSQAFLGKAALVRSKPLYWVRPPDRPGDKGAVWPDLAMRDGDWKLLVMRDGSNAKLFNLQEDVRESTNQVTSHPKIAARMTQALFSWFHGLPAPQLSSQELGLNLLQKEANGTK